MARELIVTSAFAEFARGARITDAATIDQIKGSEAEAHVVAVEVPDETPPPKKRGAPTPTSSET